MGGSKTLGGAALGLLMGACGPSSSAGTGGGGTGGEDSGGTTPLTMSGTDEGADSTGGSTTSGAVIPFGARVDILLVVDNSATMADAQRILAQSVASLVDTLGRPDVDIDYRIGITTTDNGNPWCSGTTPEGGALVFSSCRARSDEFLAGEADVSASACRDFCELDAFDIRPTAVEVGGEVAPRPWLEANAGLSNVSNASTADAIACAVPQGIIGCGFEQPLESMLKALQRASDVDSPSFGFLRDDADLEVIIVTDEADCSFADESIFSPQGDRTFWSDPDGDAPTSAVCWNAAGGCLGPECTSEDLDPLGSGTTPEAAVLHPVSRYVDALEAIEGAKQRVAPGRKVRVQIISGVGTDGSVIYQPAPDADYQDAFGIGPGCASDRGEAVPPLRMREVAEAMAADTERALSSICASSYAAALDHVAGRLAGQAPRSCFPACVADTDPTTSEVDGNCALTLEVPDGDGTLVTEALPECDDGAPPADALHCFIPLGTGPEFRCGGDGFNLGFAFRHAPASPFPLGARVVADCQLSETPELDCP